jgi:uncharacterized membrane protein
MSDLGIIISAAIGALAPVGAGVAFIWNKVERRFNEIEDQLEACRRREIAASRINATQLTVIELIWNDLKKLQPKSGTLARAHKLLEDLKSQTNGGLLP